MAKKNLKQLKHRLKKEKGELKRKEKSSNIKKEVIEQIKKDPKNAEKVAIVVPKDIKPSKIREAVKMNFRIHKNKELSDPSSRMVLHEEVGNNVVVMGLVSDIRLFKEGNALILIDNPYMCTTSGRYRRIDSHIWINTSDILGLAKTTYNVTVSIGDTLVIAAQPKEYSGYGDYGVKTYKYGLTSIVLIASGFYNSTRINESMSLSEYINNIIKYPRNNEWILKAENKKYMQIKDKPKWAYDLIDEETPQLLLEKLEEDVNEYTSYQEGVNWERSKTTK